MIKGKAIGSAILINLASKNIYNGFLLKKEANGNGMQIRENGDVFEGIFQNDLIVEGILT